MYLDSLIKKDDRAFPAMVFKNEQGKDKRNYFNNFANDEVFTKKKQEIIKTLVQTKLYYEIIRPQDKSLLDQKLITKDIEEYKSKFQKLSQKTAVSWLCTKVPSNLKPDSGKGNYSILAPDTALSDMKAMLADDIRTTNISLGELERDLCKFNEFDVFDAQNFYPYKY